jgi:Omp85 superfamily domain
MTKHFAITFIFSVFIINKSVAKAYQDANDSTANHQTKGKQVDVKDIIKKVFSKDENLKKTDLEPITKNNSFALLPSFNYSIVTGFMAGINTIQNFKANLDSQTKQSNIRTFSTYSQFKQFSSIINSNIWTKGNKINFLGDYRFYKFPSTTYGLGGNTTFDDASFVDYLHLRVYQVALRKISKHIDVGIGYHFDYHWNIEETNGDNTLVTDLKKYGLSSKSTSSGLSLNIQHDSRTSSSNPTGGNYANIQYRYNLQFLGSNQHWQSLVMDFRKYIHLPSSSNNILALWSYDWFTFSGNAPYFDLPSIGWDAYYNTGRGYPIGRFRGKNLVYFETEYRFGITRNGLLGGVVFGNAQSVSNYPNSGMSKIIPAAGGGIRLKWNKLTNTIIALDYGVGIGGSNGIIFNINEVF